MGARKEVLLSAYRRELRSYRGETKDALLTLKIFPIEQSNFELAHGPLTKVLHDLIDRCDAVIHLAGFYYGAEPPQRPVGKPRRSYTQIEYDVARELGKPIYLFLATKDCKTEILKLSERDRPEETERLAAVFRWLSENPGWLLILDNADTIQAAAEVEKTLPKLQGGDVIITSRIADWILAVQPVELDVLAHEDAAAFLLARTELQRKKTPTDTEDAPILAHELGGLALAMEQ